MKKEDNRCFISFESNKNFRERLNAVAKKEGVSKSQYIKNALTYYMNRNANN